MSNKDNELMKKVADAQNKELSKALRLMSLLATKSVQSYEYKSWTAEYCRDDTRDTIEQYGTECQLDFNGFSSAELKMLGCSLWDENDNLYLLPLWAKPFLAKGLELICIDGTTAVVGIDEVDNDARFGCLAYGVKANREKQPSVNQQLEALQAECKRYKDALERIRETEPTEKLGFFRYKIPNRADCGVIAEQALTNEDKS